MTSQEADERLRPFKVTLSELVESVKQRLKCRSDSPPLSLEGIHQGIRELYRTTSRRPSLQTGGCICGKKVSAVAQICRQHYGTTFGKEVTKVLGDGSEAWLNRLHAVIRDYWKQGVRINSKSGFIPEMDMNAGSINDRLFRHHNTILAKEVLKVIGSQSHSKNSSHEGSFAQDKP